MGSALEVSEDADELDEVAFCGIRVMGGCHDDCDLDPAAHHEEMDEAADDGVGRLLGWERVRAAGRENLEDGVKYGGSEGTGDGA